MSYADVDASGNKRENLETEDEGESCNNNEMVETNKKGCVLKDYTIPTQGCVSSLSCVTDYHKILQHYMYLYVYAFLVECERVFSVLYQTRY